MMRSNCYVKHPKIPFYICENFKKFSFAYAYNKNICIKVTPLVLFLSFTTYLPVINSILLIRVFLFKQFVKLFVVFIISPKFFMHNLKNKKIIKKHWCMSQRAIVKIQLLNFLQSLYNQKLKIEAKLIRILKYFIDEQKSIYFGLLIDG